MALAASQTKDETLFDGQLLVEIETWEGGLHVGLCSDLTPEEERFQGGLAYLRSFILNGRVVAPKSQRGKSIQLERGGELRAGVVENQKAVTLEPIVNAHVAEGATVYTDDLRSYQHLHMGYDHATVRHGAGEYVRGEAHANTIESVWALLQRQIVGIHHWVSPKHLDAYVSEMSFRYNRREMPKGDRVNNLLSQIEGPAPVQGPDRVKGRKLEPPLHLDMDPDEALARFIQTDPEEADPPKGKTRKSARPEPGAPQKPAD